MKGKHSRKTFRSRQEDMLVQLREEIVSGQRPVGQYLPSEKSLAVAFELSNKSVRCVLDVLVAEERIEKIPRVGNVITNKRAEQTVTIKLGHHGTTLHETELKALLQAFGKDNPNIRVQTITLPSNSPEILKQYMDYGMIDVMTLNDTEFRTFEESDSLDCLSPLTKKAEIYPFLNQVFSAKDKLYVQPFVFSPVVLCYNSSHFAEAGLMEPDSGWSWDELFAAADRLSIPGERIGFHFPPTHRNRSLVFLLQSGWKFERDDNGRFRVCGTGMMEALRYYREIVSSKLVPVMSESQLELHSEELFLQGKVSMIMTTYYGLNHLRQSNIRFEIAPLPMMSTPVTLLLAIGLAVNNLSPNKEAAHKLVDYLTSYSGQLIIRQKSLSIPSFKPAADWTGPDEIYRPSRFNMYREIFPTFRFCNVMGLNERQWLDFYNTVNMYWSGLESEESFCRRLEQLL